MTEQRKILALAGWKNKPTFTVDVVRELNTNQFTEYKEALGRVRRYDEDRVLWEIHLQNKQSLRTSIAALWSAHEDEPGNFPEEFRESLQIPVQHALTNYFSTFRMVLDHIEFRLSKTSVSDDYARLKQTEHAKATAYALVYKFRDFVLHCGLPGRLLSITAASRLSAMGIIREHALHFRRDQLLGEDFDWKSIRGRLEKAPEQMEVFETIDKAESSLETLWRFYQAERARSIAPDIDALFGLCIETAKSKAGFSPALAVFQPAERMQISFTWFPFRILIRFEEEFGHLLKLRVKLTDSEEFPPQLRDPELLGPIPLESPSHS